MEYHLELQFFKLNANLCFSDRFGNVLKTNTTRQGDMTCMSTSITLPNRITIEISDTQEDLNIKLAAVWLGKIKFNNNALEKMFVHYHPYGQNKSCDWNFGGKVEFDFFEHSVIKYHLIMGSTI